MFKNEHFYLDTDGHFAWVRAENAPLKILQLTDLHLGFGPLSKKKDAKAMAAVSALIGKTKPDLIVLTGDTIFPFFPSSGTLDNEKEARKLTAFMDAFKTPYALIFGNHDTEMGAKCTKSQLAALFAQGEYSIIDCASKDIFGVGNYIIKIMDANRKLTSALVLLDSNMYGDGWFFSGFDCIHADQIDWCMKSLTALRTQNETLTALAFFHMPIAEYKTAYEKMKLGDKSVVYHFGSIGEKNDYFGISKNACTFFDEALKNGVIKGMFCGHDHYNTLSLTYRGIMLTYGMSIDYLGYADIKGRYTQRGATAITVQTNGNFTVAPVPYTRVVSARVRGAKPTPVETE